MPPLEDQPVTGCNSLYRLIEGSSRWSVSAGNPLHHREPIGAWGAGKQVEKIALVFGEQNPVCQAGIDERLRAELVAHHEAAMTLAIERYDDEPPA
jgi:hypothetical protein